MFDFSLRLGSGSLARHILYGECKYRDERRGNVNTDFKEFLNRVYEALVAAEADEADSALFVFLSTLPPDDWRKYLKNKQKYCQEDLVWDVNQVVDEEVLTTLTRVVHLLVLNATIVARRG